MIRRHYCLLLVLLLAAHLTGCRPARPATERPSAGIAPRQIPADTVAAASGPDSITVTPRTSLLDKLRGRTPAPRRIPAGTVVYAGKKATVNVYNAPTVITTIGKKATAATGAAAHIAIAGKKAQQATDSAAAISSAGGAVAAGDGASATGGATETKPGFWGALLGNPVGQIGLAVIGLFIVAAGVYGFVLWKKKKQVTDILA